MPANVTMIQPAIADQHFADIVRLLNTQEMEPDTAEVTGGVVSETASQTASAFLWRYPPKASYWVSAGSTAPSPTWSEITVFT